MVVMSQSPQTGQFNSYGKPYILVYYDGDVVSQSPQTGQFNSYRVDDKVLCVSEADRSQSPQTGQFNSYYILVVKDDENGVIGLNPLKRVNSILTFKKICL